MFDLREREVVPLYFDRSEGRLPRRWVRRMKSTLASTGPFVSASRMVKDYTTDLYEPAAAHDDDMAADGHRRSRQIAAWKERITSSWSGVRGDAGESDGTMPGIGDERSVDADDRKTTRMNS